MRLRGLPPETDPRDAIVKGIPVFIDVVVVLGVIVFFGTVALARTLTREP